MQQSADIETPPALRPCSDPDATWVISDGRAGNHRQAAALAQLLQRTATEVIVTPRRPWSIAAPRLLPFSATAFTPPISDVLHGGMRTPELVIGCGRQGALATRLLKKKGAFAIQILNPRLATSHWDLVIAPEHDRMEGPNVLTLPGSIHDVSAERLARIAAQPHPMQSLPQPRIGVLVGGDTHRQAFDQDGFLSALSALPGRIAALGGSLLVTTSRRTPAALTAALRDQLSSVPALLWTGEKDAAQRGEPTENPYPGILALSDAILCSADSVSMLSEAAATEVPLLIMGAVDGDTAPQRFARQLIAMGRAQVFCPDFPIEGPVAPLSTNRDLAQRLRQLAARSRPR